MPQGREGGGKRGGRGNGKGGQEGKRSGGRSSDKDAQSTRSADDSNGEATASYQHNEERNERQGALVVTEIAHNQLSDCILTHLCWGAGEADGIVVVGQDGVLHHLKAGTEIRRVTSRQQHNLEAWCVEVSHDRNLIVSGADDSLLLGWDLRSPDVLTFSNRSHEAGVISLACNPHNDFQILSGSYDERLRLFDLRHMKEPLIRSNRLGDGAYQLSWHTNKGVFAVAAMRCGFPIFELDEAGTFERLGGYCESAGEGCHGSLGYGISWQEVQMQALRKALELAVMEEYEKQKQTGKKDIQNFTDLNSDRGAWGGGAKPVLPGKEDFLQQLQTALLHFQRARQMEDGKGN
eukprot:symbB.v1.2.036819.t2/scaffold5286.1/size30633/2